MMRIPALPRRLTWLLQLAYSTLRLFGQNGLQNHAAATSFYFLLSGTPLLLLLSYALQLLNVVAADSVPATILMAALYDQMQLERLAAFGFIARQTQLGAGSVGVLTLLLSSRWLVSAVQDAFRIIFPRRPPRHAVLSWVMPLVLVPMLFLLMCIAALAQVTLNFLAQYELIGLGNAYVLQALNSLFVFTMIWALLFVAYWRLPRQYASVRVSAAFALGATVSLALLFTLFSTFFKLENYNTLYGALGGVVFVLIGAYFSFVLMYLWAQALYAYGKADITALEKLFLAGDTGAEGSKVENYLFGDTHRLLELYGHVHPPGHHLVEEGDDSRDAYFLCSGRAAVYKNTETGPRRLTELREGQLFGEMAYLLNEKRTATVIADTEVTVLALPPHIMEELMRHSAPLSRRIIDTLCQRLEHMNLANGH